jgi:ATP-dependent Clp protease ATP-binding subunit ClpC
MKKLIFPVEMDGFKFSKELLDIFEKSAKYANIDKIFEITPINVTFAIIADEKDNIVTDVLDAMKVDVNILFEMVKDRRSFTILDQTKTYDNIFFSEELVKIIVGSYKKTMQVKNSYDLSDFFLSLLKNKSSVTQLFVDNAIEQLVFKQTYDEVIEFYKNNYDDVDGELDMDFEPQMQQIRMYQTNSKEKPQELLIKLFTTNLNVEYENGNLSECIGRDIEIGVLERVLSRANKKNCIFTGKAGSGKTQIVEGLVRRIVKKEGPIGLQNKIVLSLNLNALESGTVLRGQLEERVKILISYLEEHPEVILFIDEIHSLGNANRQNNIDLINILKPYLTKNKIQIIGATTEEEYKVYIQPSRAFARRFFVQNVDELDKESTLKILNQIKEKYELSHNVTYTDQILNEIIEFCDHNLKNKVFPDKAIDILDDLGAAVVAKQKLDKELIKINEQIHQVNITKKYVVTNKKYDEIEGIISAEKKLLKKYDKIIEKQKTKEKQEITKEMLFSYLKTSYKFDNYFGDDFEQLMGVAKNGIKSKLLGQDDIVDGVINLIETRHLFDDYNSPLTLLFIGESGVGKTYLGELLGENVFNNKVKKLHGEMFKEGHSVSNLFGSPKGYVDSEKGSELLEHVKHNPESIIIIDEIEKAHPNFYDALLSICDKGIIEDKDGFIIDFRRSVIILTSNVGSEDLKYKSIGYNNVSGDEIKEKTNKSLSKTFKPEFINRIDEIFYFNNVDNFEEILDKEFEKIKATMKKKNVDVNLSPETKIEILESCRKGKGAFRNFKRIINKRVMQDITKKYKQQCGALNI